tara:strand:+ start:6655 stop:7287 length:633 start_codon:yes stop_codon:yes gene_type:complete
MTCNPLFLKGNSHSIPNSELDKAFNIIIQMITNNKVNTICWDGDPLTLIDPKSITGVPVKSFTLLIPRIYEWASNNNTFIRFVYIKKEKSVLNLLNDAENETDKHGTYHGPFYFLSKTNTKIINSKITNENVFDNKNIAIAANNDLKWSALGINMIKWFKYNNVNSGYLLVVGKGEVVNSELNQLSNPDLYNEIPLIITTVMEFDKDPIP